VEVHKIFGSQNNKLGPPAPVVDGVGSTLGVVLKGVNAKASLENNERHDIQSADIEFTFISREAANSCMASVKSLQRQLFLSYLQYQRHEEVVQLRR